MRKITGEQLGKILLEEFERDSWGSIEPHWFVKPEDMDEYDKEHPEFDDAYDEEEAFDSMREVLDRVAERINKGDPVTSKDGSNQ